MKLSAKKIAVYKGCDIYKNQDAELVTVCNRSAFFALTLKDIKNRIDEKLREAQQ